MEHTRGSRGRAIRLLAMLLGLLVFLYGLRVLGRSYSATQWPVIPGRIVRSEVVVTEGGALAPRIEYEYILAGRVYRGFGVGSAAAESLVSQYPLGREIPVGYDPGDPSQSVLRPAIKWWSLVVTLGGAVVTAGAFWLERRSWRGRLPT